ARADYRRLLAVLYEEGYFGPTISIRIDGREAAFLPSLQPLRKVDRVAVQVAPGPRFHFALARLAPLAPGTTVGGGFQPGEPAGTGAISLAASQGVQGWREAGHAKARIGAQSITADHRDQTLDVDIVLAPGPRLRFGALHLDGKTALSDERLRRIASLPSGETYHPDELERIARRLRRTGVFRSVTISEADTAGPDGTLDIELRVEDDKPRRLTFGAELESRDGLSLSATWLHRNLLGGGERFQIDAEAAGIGGQGDNAELALQAALTRPATLRPDIDFGLSAGLLSLDNDIFRTEKLALTLGLTRTLSEHSTLYGGLLLEASNAGDDYGDRQFRTLGLPLRAIRDRRDDRLDPTRGSYVRAEAMPYASHFDGAPGLRLTGDMRAYRSLGSDRVVVAGRLQYGSVFGPGLSETPPDYLFLSGGGGTVRGHLYQSGLVTVGGRRSGGLSFLGLSGELRVRATDSVSAVAFYDAGFVGSTSDITGAGNWHAGAGIGLRYHTSIGPIRADIALPVSGGTSGGAQLYVGIGQAF
ncbi:autotransporter assembly complex family protein, partial [Shimia sp.]|uniref:autotransporter assembly complex protein TamA n=1 Tax=Shimia sp. TaxID=1954381 RepID=UPI003565CA3D